MGERAKARGSRRTCGPRARPGAPGERGGRALKLARARRYAENELPQPQPPVAFGFLKVKPEPCIDDT